MKSAERGIISDQDFTKTSNKLLYAVMVLVIVIMMASMLYPMLVTLFNGLKANVEVNTFPPSFLPKHWEWGNYNKAWKFIPLSEYLKNTLLLFVGNMVMTVFVIGLAAFSLSRLRVLHAGKIYAYFMVALFIPATTYIVPNFINLKQLGLLDSYWAIWLPAGASAYFLMLLKTFFDSLNMELFESGRIDGSSDIGLFFRLALPLSLPIFSILAIFVFSTAWNDWYWPSLVFHSDKHYPLAFAIYKYVLTARRLDTNIKFALLTFVMIPPVVVFLMFQKYILRGIQLGGVKG